MGDPKYLLIVIVLTYWGTPTPAAAFEPGGTWIVNPAEPGPDLPPAGRSLFDFLITDHSGPEPVYRIPFPFPVLRDWLVAQLRNNPQGTPPVKQVLIPLGRSLQRTAAAPDFFQYPRVVLAVDGEPAPRPGFTGMFLKDRLYIGYLEKASVLEVISYNEAAGRFEFQIVHNYRAGGSPKLAYANRAVCTACHQNATPIFSRPLWGETNANHQIAALLQQADRDFYGIPVTAGVDIPNAIDDATDRANLIPAVQFIWKHACAANPDSLEARQCRGQALRFALQYRLSGTLQFARTDNPDWQQFAAPLLSRWQAQWPQGLLISNPDIPNRIPVAAVEPVDVPGATRTRQTQPAEQEQLLQQLHVPSRFDPLRPRPPLESWTAAGSAEHFVTGLAAFFAAVDIERLDQHLFEQSNHATTARRRYQSACSLTPRQRTDGVIRISLQCNATGSATAAHFSMSGRVYLRGREVVRGVIDRLAWGDAAVLTDLAVSAGDLDRLSDTLTLHLSRGPLHARGPDGDAIEDVQISWEIQDRSEGTEELPARVQAVLILRDDYQAVREAIQVLSKASGDTADALSSTPFRRVSFLNALYHPLGIPAMQACCVDATRLPPPVADTHPDDATLQQVVAADPAIPELGFYRHCSTCHRSSERFPPNFLQGGPSQVRDHLAHCAERLYVRLHMWDVPIAARTKTPMPPVHALEQLGLNAATWPNSTALESLQAYTRKLLQAETGTAPLLEDLIARDYENLRPCLAGPSEPQNTTLGLLNIH
jgi:hypothetical protein